MLFRVSMSALAAALFLTAPAEAGPGWSSRSSGGFGVGGSRAYASGSFARSHRGYGSTYDRGGITVPGDDYDYDGYGSGRVVNNVTTIVGSDRGDEGRRRIVPHYVPVPMPVPALSATQEQVAGPVLYRIHKAPGAATLQSRTRAAARSDLGNGAWSGARIVDVHVR